MVKCAPLTTFGVHARFLLDVPTMFKEQLAKQSVNVSMHTKQQQNQHPYQHREISHAFSPQTMCAPSPPLVLAALPPMPHAQGVQLDDLLSACQAWVPSAEAIQQTNEQAQACAVVQAQEQWDKQSSLLNKQYLESVHQEQARHEEAMRTLRQAHNTQSTTIDHERDGKIKQAQQALPVLAESAATIAAVKAKAEETDQLLSGAIVEIEAAAAGVEGTVPKRGPGESSGAIHTQASVPAPVEELKRRRNANKENQKQQRLPLEHNISASPTATSANTSNRQMTQAQAPAATITPVVLAAPRALATTIATTTATKSKVHSPGYGRVTPSTATGPRTTNHSAKTKAIAATVNINTAATSMLEPVASTCTPSLAGDASVATQKEGDKKDTALPEPETNRLAQKRAKLDELKRRRNASKEKQKEAQAEQARLLAVQHVQAQKQQEVQQKQHEYVSIGF